MLSAIDGLRLALVLVPLFLLVSLLCAAARGPILIGTLGRRAGVVAAVLSGCCWLGLAIAAASNDTTVDLVRGIPATASGLGRVIAAIGTSAGLCLSIVLIGTVAVQFIHHRGVGFVVSGVALVASGTSNFVADPLSRSVSVLAQPESGTSALIGVALMGVGIAGFTAALTIRPLVQAPSTISVPAFQQDGAGVPRRSVAPPRPARARHSRPSNPQAAQASKAGPSCSECGAPIRVQDQVCPLCGEPIHASQLSSGVP